jgi:hypothetical protein
MSTLTVATIKPHNSLALEVVWVSGTNRFEIRDETGRIGNPHGYRDSVRALTAAARIAADRYNDALVRS